VSACGVPGADDPRELGSDGPPAGSAGGGGRQCSAGVASLAACQSMRCLPTMPTRRRWSSACQCHVACTDSSSASAMSNLESGSKGAREGILGWKQEHMRDAIDIVIIWIKEVHAE